MYAKLGLGLSPPIIVGVLKNGFRSITFERLVNWIHILYTSM